MTEGRDGPPRSGTGPDRSRQEQHPLPDFCVDADNNESPPKSKEKGGGGEPFARVWPCRRLECPDRGNARRAILILVIDPA